MRTKTQSNTIARNKKRGRPSSFIRETLESGLEILHRQGEVIAAHMPGEWFVMANEVKQWDRRKVQAFAEHRGVREESIQRLGRNRIRVLLAAQRITVPVVALAMMFMAAGNDAHAKDDRAHLMHGREIVETFPNAVACNERLMVVAASELQDPSRTSIEWGCVNADGFRPTAVILWRDADYRLAQDIDLTARRGGDRP